MPLCHENITLANNLFLAGKRNLSDDDISINVMTIIIMIIYLEYFLQVVTKLYVPN